MIDGTTVTRELVVGCVEDDPAIRALVEDREPDHDRDDEREVTHPPRRLRGGRKQDRQHVEVVVRRVAAATDPFERHDQEDPAVAGEVDPV